MKNIVKTFTILLVTAMLLTSLITVSNLAIAKTSALATEKTNLFKGATATANSVLSDGYAISNAFDGGIEKDDSRWVTAINGANPAVANITLAKATSIQSVVIYERFYGGDPDARGRITNFSIYSVDGSGTRKTIVSDLPAVALAKDDITVHKINFDAPITSAKFELKLQLHKRGISEGANIIQIQGFANEQSVPGNKSDPDAPKDTKDFAVGAKIDASSEVAQDYPATAAILPFDPYYATESRWSVPSAQDDISAELAFAEPAMISFVKVVQYEGPKPKGWSFGKRITSIKVELADDGEAYTVVANGAPVSIDSTELPFVASGVLKKLETPIKATRMRISVVSNNHGKAEGVNIKTIEAYGVLSTVSKPTINTELRNTLNVAYSKKVADYTNESWDSFKRELATTKDIFTAGKKATDAQVTTAINNMCDATYALNKKSVKAKRIKIAFVGDSITYGHYLSDPAGQCFSAIAQKKLGKESYEIKNFAISGRTLTNRSELPYMKETLYKNSMSFLPDVVVITLGTNDSKPKYNLTKEQYFEDARKLINSYKLLDSQPVIFFNTSPKAVLSLGGGSDIITPSGVAKVAKWQKEILAEIPDICQMDLFNETKDFTTADYKADDGVHPNLLGHDKLSDIVISNLNSAKQTLILSNRLYLLSLDSLESIGYAPKIWKEFNDARVALTASFTSATSTAQDIISARTALDNALKLLPDNIDNTKIRLACVGDSITKGDGAGEYIYPTYLQTQFNLKEANRFIVRNYGENGMMASDRQDSGLLDPSTIGGTFEYYKKFTSSQSFLPNVVTIKLGTNDAKYIGENAPLFKNDMIKIINAYKALPSKPQIILITSSWAQVTPGHLTSDWANAINNQIVPLQIELANELGLPLININKYTKYHYDNKLSVPPSDGIHGNYKTIAEGVWKGLMGDGMLNGSSYVINDPAGAFNDVYLRKNL